MAARKPRVLVATTTFQAQVDGVERLVYEGERVPAGHQFVKGREALFKPHDPNEATIDN